MIISPQTDILRGMRSPTTPEQTPVIIVHVSEENECGQRVIAVQGESPVCGGQISIKGSICQGCERRCQVTFRKAVSLPVQFAY